MTPGESVPAVPEPIAVTPQAQPPEPATQQPSMDQLQNQLRLATAKNLKTELDKKQVGDLKVEGADDNLNIINGTVTLSTNLSDLLSAQGLEDSERDLLNKAFEAALTEAASKYADRGVTPDVIRAWIFSAQINTSINTMGTTLGGSSADDLSHMGNNIVKPDEASKLIILLLGESAGNTPAEQIKALQKKLNDFRKIIVATPETEATKQLKKGLGDAKFAELKKLFEDKMLVDALKQQDPNGDLLSDGKFGKRTLMMLSLYKKVCDALGAPSASPQEAVAEKPKEFDVKYETFEVNGIKITDGKIHVKETKVAATDENPSPKPKREYTFTFKVGDMDCTRSGDELKNFEKDLAKLVKPDNEKLQTIPDSIKNSQMIKDLATYQNVMALRSNSGLTDTQFVNGAEGALYQLAGLDPQKKEDEKQFEEIFGSEVEITPEDLKQFKETGKLIFGLDWDGGDTNYGEDDAKVELKKDEQGKLSMNVVVRGIHKDGYDKTADYKKALDEAKDKSYKIGTENDEVAIKQAKELLGKGANGNYLDEPVSMLISGSALNLKETLKALKNCHNAWLALKSKLPS